MGTEGAGKGQLQFPTDVAFDAAGNIYVADAYNHRVQKWASDGSFVGVWGSQGSEREQFDVPSGLAVDSEDVVHVADSGNRRIVARTTAGQVVPSGN